MARGKNAEAKQQFIDALIENADNALSTMDIVPLTQTQIKKLLTDGNITQEQADILSGDTNPMPKSIQTISEPINEPAKPEDSIMQNITHMPVEVVSTDRETIKQILMEILSEFPKSRYIDTEAVDNQLDKVDGKQDRLTEGDNIRIIDNVISAIVPERRINWRGIFIVGNTYNTDDGVEHNDKEWVANMDGIVLPPPSKGWDEWQIGSIMDNRINKIESRIATIENLLNQPGYQLLFDPEPQPQQEEQ